MRYQNLKSFQKHLSSAAPHHLCRIYLIAMADDFERTKVLDALLSYFPESFPTRFNGNDLILRDLLDAMQSPSLLGGDPIILLDEMEKIAKKDLQTLFAHLTTGCYLFLGSRTKSPFAADVEKQGVILDLTDEKPWDKEKRFVEQLVEKAKNSGKRLSPDAVQFLFERLDKDPALLENELNKLICYVGEKTSIEKEDIARISASSRTHTLWQTAEEVIWEGGKFPPLDSTSFHGLLPILRSQLQLGLKLTSLIDSKCPSQEWSTHLPKIWPKTLEKRSAQAARLGTPFFKKGMEKLFEIELLSRNQSTQYGALLDFFRSYLYGR